MEKLPLSPTILVVDDDPEVVQCHAEIVKSLGYSCRAETTHQNIESLLRTDMPLDLVLLDVRMPGVEGLDLFDRIRTVRPQLGVVLATVVNDIDLAVRAIKKGAFNYLLKPLETDRVGRVLASYFESRPTTFQVDPRFGSFITGDPRFGEVFRRIQNYADADVPVLVHGETGTGKELVARISHSLSRRSHQPFFAVNIAALTPTLFESELFGYGRGAFTGASGERAGYFEAVGEGTLFLDEIGELDADQQKKLLRVLQTRQFTRIGQTQERSFRGRLIFATNRNLRDAVRSGAFRSDLFFRMASYAIELPALRDRSGDIDLLAKFFFQKYNSQFGRNLDGFEPRTMEALRRYSYPGNVRELEGIVSAAVLIERESRIRPSSLPAHVTAHYELSSEKGRIHSTRLRTILLVLAECKGNQTAAARKLGIARQSLNRILRKLREREDADADGVAS